MPSFKNEFNRLFIQKNDQFFTQFFRCTVAGGIAFMVDFSTFALLTELCNLHYIVSNTISFTFGVCVNYFITVFWVFTSSKFENKKLEFLSFTIIAIIGLILSNLLLWGFTHFLGIHHLLSKALSAVIAYIWNFLMKKYWLFNSNKNCV